MELKRDTDWEHDRLSDSEMYDVLIISIREIIDLIDIYDSDSEGESDFDFAPLHTRRPWLVLDTDSDISDISDNNDEDYHDYDYLSDMSM